MDFTSLTKEQILDFGKPCKEFEEALERTSKPDGGIDYSNPNKALATLRAYIDSFVKSDQKDPDVDEESISILARDGSQLELLVFRRHKYKITTEAAPSNSPLIVLYFPGGFIYGHPRTMAPIARPLVKQFNAVVVAPSYRLAPEHPFPTGFNDGWDTFSWVADNASSLGANPSKGFIIGGVSSGANICIPVTHIARENAKQPPITGVWLCCAGARAAPRLADQLPEKYHERYLSRQQDECINGPAASPGHDKMKKDALKADPESELYSPLIWPTEAGHKDLPPHYLQVTGMEPSRDELLIFDNMLKNEGVSTKLDLYPGLPHAFWLTYKDLPQSKQVQLDTFAGLGWLLEQV